MTLQEQKDLDKAEKSKSKNLTTNSSEVERAYWEMNGSDKSSYYKVRKQAEQFLKE